MPAGLILVHELFHRYPDNLPIPGDFFGGSVGISNDPVKISSDDKIMVCLSESAILYLALPQGFFRLLAVGRISSN